VNKDFLFLTSFSPKAYLVEIKHIYFLIPNSDWRFTNLSSYNAKTNIVFGTEVALL
jgi:hypothetical protein